MLRAKIFRELSTQIGLDRASVDRFPYEFYGGQRQRIGLVRELALRPEILVAGQPVSARDVSVKAQVLKLSADLRLKLGLSLVFITRDLSIAAQICDVLAVMTDGEVVDSGPTAKVFENERHLCTRALLASVPGRSCARNDSIARDHGI